MSTRVGVLAEGLIDHALIAPLLRGIALQFAGFDWPVEPLDAAEPLNMRPRGYGGVWQAVRRIVRVFKETDLPYTFVVILLDRRSKGAERRIRRLIQGDERFILAVAQEEIEAWWLGDRRNTITWLGFVQAPEKSRYAQPRYQAEQDKNPKKTLDELTWYSSRFDRTYGEGNLDLARDFAESWEGRVDFQGIEQQCPQRFPPFRQETTRAFVETKEDQGRIV